MNTTRDQNLQSRLVQLAHRAPDSTISVADLRSHAAARRRRHRLLISASALVLASAGMVGVFAVTQRDSSTKSVSAPAPTTTTAPTSTSTEAAEPASTIDPTGPVAVTGIRIGESDPTNPPMPGRRPDGSVDLDKVPEWIAVGDPAAPERGCIGYVRKEDLWPLDATPETANDPIVIYDEMEKPIGEIANGETTIFET